MACLELHVISDIDHVRHAVDQIRRQIIQSMSAWKDISGHLASLAKSSNHRMDDRWRLSSSVTLAYAT